MIHAHDDTPAEVQLRTPEELRMHETLRVNAPQYASAFLKQLPRARTVVLHRLLAALWREDIGEIRTASRRLDLMPRVPDRADLSALESQLRAIRPGSWFVLQLEAAVVLAFPV